MRSVYISADIEGCTGVVNWKQCGSPDGSCFDWAFARRMMTHDVNAAIRGARAGGADRIVVKDSHNVSMNLLIDELEDGVELISGSRPGPDGMMEGINLERYDRAFLVGYHGKAGTAEGVMEHTISGRVHRLWLNDVEQGEMGLSVFAAGHSLVPVALVVSDDKGCAEAAQLIPGVSTAVTKFGMGRYMARLKSDSVTRQEIENAAQYAMNLEPKVITCEMPARVKIEFNRSEEVDHASQLPGWIRSGAYLIEQQFNDWISAHVAIRRAISFAGMV